LKRNNQSKKEGRYQGREAGRKSPRPGPSYRKLRPPDGPDDHGDDLKSLSTPDIRKIKQYELKHKNRAGLLEKIERTLKEDKRHKVSPIPLHPILIASR